MTGTTGIESVFEIDQRLSALLANLHSECIAVTLQWDGLGKAGGQRDDHAASLLVAVRVHLRAIEHTAGVMANQIEAIEANPFGD